MNTETVNGSQMTLGECMPEIFQTQTVGASDSHVRTYPLQESNSDLLATAQACFSELCTFLDNSKKKKDPLTCSLRTLKICLVLMEDGISPDFSLKWIGGGTMRNGVFSTVNTSESHKTGNAVLLSDILEVEVPQKYFLSKEQTERIIFAEPLDTAKCIGKTDSSWIGTGSPNPLTQEQGGGRGLHTIEVIGYTRESKVADRTRILGGGGYQPVSPQHRSQRPGESRVVVVGNTNPSGNGMNGNCYFSEGLNPTLTCNKNEGSRVAIPVLAPDRANKRQNGRRFKRDGEEAFTLTSQDRHGVAVEVNVQPVQMSGCKVSEQSDEAHSLNCTDQRKVFGAHQKRTMVGYNATLKSGGGMTETALALNARDYKGLSGSKQMMTAAAMLIGDGDG